MQIAVLLRHSKKLSRVAVPPTVSLLRYAYDAEAKRARQERIGTVDFWADELPPELLKQLTREEREDWLDFVHDRNEQERRATQRFHLQHIVEALANAAKALDDGEKLAMPKRFWDALDVFGQAMERNGFARVKREKGRPSKALTVTADLLLNPEQDPADYWDHKASAEASAALPDFTPPGARRGKRTFPAYPEEDLVARALRLTVGSGDGDMPAVSKAR